jgi:hypothetical protein
MKSFISTSYVLSPPNEIRYLEESLCHTGTLESSNQYGNVKEDGPVTNEDHPVITILERP